MAMVPLSILIDPDDLASIDRIAARLGVTRSDVVRNMIRELIPSYGRTAKAVHNPMVKALLRTLLAGDHEAQLKLELMYNEMQEGGHIAT